MRPMMDVYEAARRMRASPADEWAPTIFLSSMDADSIAVRSKDHEK
jgi:CheY-like chemotaxis protein